MSQRNPSNAAAFRLPAEVIDLPVPSDSGECLCVKVRAMTEAEYLDWKAQLRKDEAIKDADEKEMAARAMLTQFGRSYVLEPALFDGSPEPWASVHFMNRRAIMEAVVRLSISGPGGGDSLARFPDGVEGVAAGGGDPSGSEGAGGGASPSSG